MSPSGKVRTLVIQANPPDTAPLETNVEQRNLDAALWASLQRDLFAPPAFLPAMRVDDLATALRRHRPHILHYMGHGDGRGGLLLNAPGDEEFQILPAAAFAETLQAYQAEAEEAVRLVVLAGCHTARTAELLSATVPCVFGIDGAIGDLAVRNVFTPALYAALGDGRSVQNALDSTLAALRSHLYTADAEMVRLYVHNGVDASQERPAAWLQTVVQLSPLHLEYLRGLFGQPWANVSLADILEARQEHARLLDIYVPLPVTCELVVKTAEHRIVDWWVKTDEPDQDGVEAHRNQVLGKNPISDAHEIAPTKLRRWHELAVDEAGLQTIVDGIQAKIDARRAAGEPTKDGEHTWYMEAHDAASVQPRFVLLGDPGSGKSSFLHHLALCLAGELRSRAGDTGVPANANLAALRDWLLDAYTPIYIEMRSLVRESFPELPAARNQPPALPNTAHLWNYVRTHVLDAGERAFESELRGLTADGKAILLLDGLDEIPAADDPRRRTQIKAFVTALVETYPPLRVIIAGRPHAYRVGEWSLARFGHTTLQPLHMSRIEELARALFAVAAPGQRNEQVSAFLQDLRDNTHVEASLYANPLFFTLLAALWLNAPERRLPTTQAELYRQAVDLLLDRWTRRRAPDPSLADNLGLNTEELRAVLETLACTVHEQAAPGQDTTVFHGKELLGILLEAGFQVGIRDVPQYLEQHAGLLVSPSANHFYFSHRSFQEHLAACELTCREPGKRNPPVADERRFPHGLVRRLAAQPALWQNVAFLAAEELRAQGRQDELWKLLVACCRHTLKSGEPSPAGFTALEIAKRHSLFAIDPDEPPYGLPAPLRERALAVLTDAIHFTPEQRNLAGELLGRRPEHDTRRGVGLRPDGLPDIDWVEIPAVDASGRHEFIYQEHERRVEPVFWIARYLVTYRQYQAFLDAADGFANPAWWQGLAAPANHRAPSGNQYFQYWNHPRDSVSWWDAIAFCRWLTRRAQEISDLLPPALRRRRDWRITLPTEWQWEKAARGHDGRRYPWGPDYLSGYANINETSAGVGPHHLGKTSAIGMYPHGASPNGVLDMAGNVWEWCLNEYERLDRIQEEGNAARVVRGGSWNYDHHIAAASFRFRFNFHYRFGNRGLRLVVVGVPSLAPQ